MYVRCGKLVERRRSKGTGSRRREERWQINKYCVILKGNKRRRSKKWKWRSMNYERRGGRRERRREEGKEGRGVGEVEKGSGK